MISHCVTVEPKNNDILSSVFILQTETYTIYESIYLSFAARTPTLISVRRYHLQYINAYIAQNMHFIVSAFWSHVKHEYTLIYMLI